AHLEQLRPLVAGPPAAVLHPLPAEVMFEGEADRLELVAPLANQALDDRRERRRDALVGIEREQPTGLGGLGSEVARGIEGLGASAGLPPGRCRAVGRLWT